MSYVRINSACYSAAQILPVTVEVDIQKGLPVFSLIGLPDAYLREASQRIKSAIKNSGYTFPMGKITVNLSPANYPKQGNLLDLPIALGILCAAQKIKPGTDWVFGGLDLSGEVLGGQALVGMLAAASEKNVGCLIPESQADSAQLVPECPVSPIANLRDALDTFCAPTKPRLPTKLNEPSSSILDHYLIDEIQGNQEAKRALVIALAGNHHLCLSGAPGSGKTMLAQAAGQLLPRLSRQQELQRYQLEGYYQESFTDLNVPFRAPHHSLTRSALIGGGSRMLPGEISMANHGILFLDEFPEISREAREALRQPLEEGEIRLSKGGISYHYPAQSLVILAKNLCPCGLMGSKEGGCRCNLSELKRYEKAISEPLAERIHLFAYTTPQGTTSSREGIGLATTILKAREAQQRRNKGIHNSALNIADLEIDKDATRLLDLSRKKLHLSWRVAHNLARVARTIADLEESVSIHSRHLEEALQYRQRQLG